VGGLTLSNANTVRFLSANNTGSGNVNFANSGSALDVSVNNGAGTGSVFVKSAGDLGLLTGGVSTPATGTAATLVAGGNFLNPNNYNITLTGSGARWLIYSTNPSANTVGTPLSSATNFQQYGATYPSTTVLGTSNGLLYSLAGSATPLSFSLVGTVSKVFDGGTSAPLTSANYVLGGATDALFGSSTGASVSAWDRALIQPRTWGRESV
jgi:hypothetical protein